MDGPVPDILIILDAGEQENDPEGIESLLGKEKVESLAPGLD